MPDAISPLPCAPNPLAVLQEESIPHTVWANVKDVLRTKSQGRCELLEKALEGPHAPICIEVEARGRSGEKGLLRDLREIETWQVALICKEGSGIHVQILRPLRPCGIVVLTAVGAVAVDPEETRRVQASTSSVRHVPEILAELCALCNNLLSCDDARRGHFTR